MSFPRIKPFADADAFMSYADFERELEELAAARHKLVEQDGLRRDYEKLESRMQEIHHAMFLVDLERQVDACAFKISKSVGCTQIEAQSLSRALVWLNDITPRSTRRSIDEVSLSIPSRLSEQTSLTVGEMRKHHTSRVNEAKARRDALVNEVNAIKKEMSRDDITISYHHDLHVRLKEIVEGDASMFVDASEIIPLYRELDDAQRKQSMVEDQLKDLDDGLDFFISAFSSSYRDRSHRQLDIEESDHDMFGASRSAMVVYGLIMGHLRVTYKHNHVS